jgi:2-keto-4-pentenoate hydratase/2-oxohepta-3-ene-1,7-dioic acid hydratase in catechol pathway
LKRARWIHPLTGRHVHGVLHEDTVSTRSDAFPLRCVQLLPPCRPTKLVCVGRNYADHAKELGNTVPDHPMLFLKPPSSVIGPDCPIVLPDSQEVHFEGELAVVIGKRCRHVPATQADRVILGYTCLNDVSDRVTQRWEKNWVRAKAFDTSAPLGPVLVTSDEIEPPFHLQTRRNGVLCQNATTDDLVFPIPTLIEVISSIMTLEPGDVIATGTPAGVGALAPGDVVEIEIEGIGVLRNPVVAADLKGTPV